MDENGYLRFSDSGIKVHRWAAEKKIGRRLRPGEVVHHKNRIKTDNRLENLEVLPNQEIHDRIHQLDAIKYGTDASYRGINLPDSEIDYYDEFPPENHHIEYYDNYRPSILKSIIFHIRNRWR